MKLFFWVYIMNRLGEKMGEPNLKTLGQTDHPSDNLPAGLFFSDMLDADMRNFGKAAKRHENC